MEKHKNSSPGEFTDLQKFAALKSHISELLSQTMSKITRIEIELKNLRDSIETIKQFAKTF